MRDKAARMPNTVPPGAYEQLLTQDLDLLLRNARADGLHEVIRDIDPIDVPAFLAHHVGERVRAALAAMPKGDERIEAQLAVANRLIELLRTTDGHHAVDEGDAVVTPARKLLALIAPDGSGLATPEAPERPSIPLNTSALLVNGPRDLSVGPEICKELASADRVDLLVSFLKWKGLRVLKDSLRKFLDRRPGGLRVLTTTYMGATEPRVLEALVQMGAEVKVSYDTRRTRLHAKAWLFQRDSGFSTAIIGSSNISAQALLDGLEWNVRLSKIDNRDILGRFEGVFAQYWEQGEFEPFDAEKFREAIRAQSTQEQPGLRAHIDVRPYEFQQAILDELAFERAQGHHKNLVVAATGTGKTVIAALDYRRLQAARPSASSCVTAASASCWSAAKGPQTAGMSLPPSSRSARRASWRCRPTTTTSSSSTSFTTPRRRPTRRSLRTCGPRSSSA